eukprot:g375.t1
MAYHTKAWRARITRLCAQIHDKVNAHDFDYLHKANFISFKQFRRALHKCGINAENEDDILDVFSMFDEDENGVLSWRELVSTLKNEHGDQELPKQNEEEEQFTENIRHQMKSVTELEKRRKRFRDRKRPRGAAARVTSQSNGDGGKTADFFTKRIEESRKKRDKERERFKKSLSKNFNGPSIEIFTPPRQQNQVKKKAVEELKEERNIENSPTKNKIETKRKTVNEKVFDSLENVWGSSKDSFNVWSNSHHDDSFERTAPHTPALTIEELTKSNIHVSSPEEETKNAMMNIQGVLNSQVEEMKKQHSSEMNALLARANVEKFSAIQKALDESQGYAERMIHVKSRDAERHAEERIREVLVKKQSELDTALRQMRKECEDEKNAIYEKAEKIVEEKRDEYKKLKALLESEKLTAIRKAEARLRDELEYKHNATLRRLEREKDDLKAELEEMKRQKNEEIRSAEERIRVEMEAKMRQITKEQRVNFEQEASEKTKLAVKSAVESVSKLHEKDKERYIKEVEQSRKLARDSLRIAKEQELLRNQNFEARQKKQKRLLEKFWHAMELGCQELSEAMALPPLTSSSSLDEEGAERRGGFSRMKF